MNEGTIPARPASYDKKVGLVLQGGGALGSYQAGVYETLAASEYLPDWVAGISIGAINAAIIAGNPQQRASALAALVFGQPGFFLPSGPHEWLSPGNVASYYDTAALKGTLERLVD